MCDFKNNFIKIMQPLFCKRAPTVTFSKFMCSKTLKNWYSVICERITAAS